MKFFSRKKSPKVPNIRDGSLRVQRDQDENTQVFSSAYKQIIQESMDATVAPLLSSDNAGTSEQDILNETENTTEQSTLYDNHILLQSQPPIYGGSFQIQDETVTQPDTITLLNQRKEKEILLLAKGFFLVVFFCIANVVFGREFLSSVLLLLVGFAGGYFYLLVSNIVKGARGTLQELDAAGREGAAVAQRAYRETIENSVSLEPCLQAAQNAYSQFCIENHVAPSRLTPLNTEEMRQRICDEFANAVSNEILRVNNRRMERSDI